MYNAKDIAQYFILAEPEKYNKRMIERNGSKFYEGNARLNKYIQLSQNLYITKFGIPLVDDMLLAYSNGAIVYNVMSNYSQLITNKDNPTRIAEKDKEFLDRFIVMFKNSTIDDLIELSHEDDAWLCAREKAKNGRSQKMYPNKYLETYKQQYSDAVLIMDKIKL